MPVCVLVYVLNIRYMQPNLPAPINKPLLSCCPPLRIAAVTMETKCNVYPEDCDPYLYVSLVGTCAHAWVSSGWAFTHDIE